MLNEKKYSAKHLSVRNEFITPQQYRLIRKLWCMNLRMLDIIRLVKVSERTVRNYTADLPRRKNAGGKTKTPPPPDPSMTEEERQARLVERRRALDRERKRRQMIRNLLKKYEQESVS